MARDEDDVAAAAASVRRWVDVATWTAIGLGLAFTAVNVQVFAAAGAPAWSPSWVVAWLLDPMVSVLLLAVVRAEQLTARWQVPMGWQVTAVKWAAFAATYAMNTWAAWRDGVPSSVVLHSVPPVFVLLAAEVAPALRDRLTEAVGRAETLRQQQVVAPARRGADDATDSMMEAGAAVEAPVVASAQQHTSSAATRRDASPPDAVLKLATRLAAGEVLSGATVAAERECSERNARRLLAEARRFVIHLVPSDSSADAEPGQVPSAATDLLAGRSS